MFIACPIGHYPVDVVLPHDNVIMNASSEWDDGPGFVYLTACKNQVVMPVYLLPVGAGDGTARIKRVVRHLFSEVIGDAPHIPAVITSSNERAVT